MCDEVDQDRQIRPVSIRIQSGLLDTDRNGYAGLLARGEDGFNLSWMQSSDDRTETQLKYSLTYHRSKELLIMERSGSGKLDLCFQPGSVTEGYLTIPQGQMCLEIQTLSMMIPEFTGADSSFVRAEYELVINYRLLFHGADPTENLLSMKITLETEKKAL